ncbi:MAG: hypothetical protein JXA94_05580 [Parachlamydiales bacterium]|nr:hypothetical protein [Parachlamydiales bacterium]
MDLTKVLGSYSEYQKFMKGEEPIAQFKENGKKNIEYLGYNSNFYKRAKNISRLSLTIFKEYFLTMITTYHYFPEINPHFIKAMESSHELKQVYELGSRFLVPSKNCLSEDESQRSVPLKLIDPKLKKHLFVNEENEKVLNLSDKDGMCRGMSEWFIYLYLNTYKDFKNRESHIIAIANLFKKGSPVEGVLSQKFYRVSNFYTPLAMESIYTLSIFDLPHTKTNAIKSLKLLPNGIYKTSHDVRNANPHAAVLIKLSDKCVYFWDPNIGLIKEDGKNIENRIIKYHENICRNKLSRLDLTKIDNVMNDNFFAIVLEKYPHIFTFKGSKFSRYNPLNWINNTLHFMHLIATYGVYCVFFPVLFVFYFLKVFFEDQKFTKSFHDLLDDAKKQMRAVFLPAFFRYSEKMKEY